MKNKKRLIPIIILLVCLFLVPMSVRADFGDFAGDADYGGGGGGGYGGDYGGGGGSDSDGGGSIDLFELFHIIFSIIHLLGWKGMLILLAFIVILYLTGQFPKKRSPGQPVQTYTPPADSEILEPISSFLSIDPNFSEADFKEKISNFYIHFQQSWQAKDISDLRPYLTDTAFAKADRQLENYRRSGQTNHVDRPTVLSVVLKGWKKDQDNHVMVAIVNARIVDYVTDDTTGELVRGSKSKEKFMTYEWRLIRSADKKTVSASGTSSVTCPFCGANVDINHSAVCEYCGSVIHDDTFDWVVSEIKGIAQKTV